jgi:hypothetical protein
MERSGPLSAMEEASGARDGEERAHATERRRVGWEEEECVCLFFFRQAMRGSKSGRGVRPDGRTHRIIIGFFFTRKH